MLGWTIEITRQGLAITLACIATGGAALAQDMPPMPPPAPPTPAATAAPALTNALQAENWDPSVKALVPFPRILQIMSDQLQWTEALGNAFLTQQADVMAAVQSLRQEAMAAGNLKQTPQCRCVIHSGGGAISILPAEPQVVCPPVYTPAVYGALAIPSLPALLLSCAGGVRFCAGLLDRFCAPHRGRSVRAVLGLGLDRLGKSLDRG